MTIVCGTDFSENAAQAARAAAAIAQSVREPLQLVHVLGKALHELPGLAALYEPMRVLLAEQAKKLATEFAVEVEPVVLEGVADERLAEQARAVQARLLVVSALGAREQDHWLLGSVAERVVQRSQTPTLVVREAASIQAWARGERPLRVMLGVDQGQSSKSALHWVETLRTIRPCNVQIVQVAWPIGEHARFGVKGPVELEGLRPDLRLLLERDLRAWVGALKGPGEVSFLVSACWGRFDAHLALLASEHRADLLVLGTHQRAWAARVWQGSVSRGAVQNCSGNVACVPRSAVAEQAPSIARFRSVLIPTDLSPLANRAIAAGYGLVGIAGQVHLLYVIAGEHASPPPDLRERLHALIPPSADAYGIVTQLHVVDEATPWEGICHHATRWAVDAICMATHGHSAALGVLLGSQAQQVVSRVSQPVLLVKTQPD